MGSVESYAMVSMPSMAGMSGVWHTPRSDLGLGGWDWFDPVHTGAIQLFTQHF